MALASDDDVDAWLLGPAVMAYDTLAMYDMPLVPRVLCWTGRDQYELAVAGDDQVGFCLEKLLPSCPSVRHHSSCLQLQVVRLPVKIGAGEESDELYDERDLDIVCGGFTSHQPKVRMRPQLHRSQRKALNPLVLQSSFVLVSRFTVFLRRM